jgi:hypothetical protein
MKIVKAAEKMIDEQAKAPRTGSLSNAPYRLKNCPTKLTVRDVPLFPKHRIKKSHENND